MAVDDFQVGQGNYALAYGKHVVAGILAGYDDSVPTAVKIKVLLGMGEWNAITEASYDGSIISTSNYTFHPGTLSTGASDPLQGTDTRFPNSIFHNRIAYYTMTLPDGMGADERPDKMRVIAETLKVRTYDENGMEVDYGYSTNPANVFADIVRRNTTRLGLDFHDHMDWDAYTEARLRYDNTIIVDDGVRTPQDVAAVNSTVSGALAAGTWYYKIVSTGSGIDKSAPSEVVAVQAAASSKNLISWTAVTGATGYRIYYSYNDPNTFGNFFTSGTNTFEHTTTVGASTGAPPNLPTGTWAATTEEFQSHRAFTTTDILTGDALTAVMFDAASEWVRDGKKYRILLPNRSQISHVFDVNNTTPDGFSYAKVPVRERINRVNTVFRNLDKRMKPDEQSPPVGNDFDLQTRVGIKPETIALGSMNTSQMRRIAGWRRKYFHNKPRRLKLTGQGDSAHVLVGDLVDVIDRQAGTRDIYGGVANDGIIVSSTINGTISSGTNAGWVGTPVPSGRSQALSLQAKTGAAAATFTLGTPVVVGANASILFYLKVADSPTNAEFSIGFESLETGTIWAGSFRKAQTPHSFGYANEKRLGVIPSKGRWIPFRVKLSDLNFVAGESLTEVHVNLDNVNAIMSEVVYFEEAPRTYLIEDVEDRDSESTDDRLFTMRELYPNAYNVTDAYISPPVTGGGEITVPTLDDLSLAGGVITGGVTNGGGTGTIRVYRKLESTGTYAEVTSIAHDDPSFDDTVTVDGLYFYKLSQDGVEGFSNELSINVSLGGDPPSGLSATIEEETPGVFVITLNWTNNGGTGNNVVQRKIGTGSWFTRATLASSEDSYLDGYTGLNGTLLTYRVYNESTSGYSNEDSVTT
jgi:hypothetical protein